jgi:hypothetical protein
MIRIALPYIWTLNKQVEPLDDLPVVDTPYSDVFLPLIVASNAITTLHQSIWGPYLRVSYNSGDQLVTALNVETADPKFDRVVAGFTLTAIKNLYVQYRTALLAELGAFDAYFVTRKGGFDTLTLLQTGEHLFPPELAAKVQEAVFDIREACKCLAYEVPTAAGFHLFRALETVLRRYYSQVTAGAQTPGSRNIGAYLNSLTQAGKGDPKVLAIIKQTADLYRNPLIHPEVILTVEEALSLVGIVRSAISEMLAVLPVPLPTTTGAVGAPSPATSAPSQAAP